MRSQLTNIVQSIFNPRIKWIKDNTKLQPLGLWEGILQFIYIYYLVQHTLLCHRPAFHRSTSTLFNLLLHPRLHQSPPSPALSPPLSSSLSGSVSITASSLLHHVLGPHCLVKSTKSTLGIQSPLEDIYTPHDLNSSTYIEIATSFSFFCIQQNATLEAFVPCLKE